MEASPNKKSPSEIHSLLVGYQQANENNHKFPSEEREALEKKCYQECIDAGLTDDEITRGTYIH